MAEDLSELMSIKRQPLTSVQDVDIVVDQQQLKLKDVIVKKRRGRVPKKSLSKQTRKVIKQTMIPTSTSETFTQPRSRKRKRSFASPQLDSYPRKMSIRLLVANKIRIGIEPLELPETVEYAKDPQVDSDNPNKLLFLASLNLVPLIKEIPNTNDSSFNATHNEKYITERENQYTDTSKLDRYLSFRRGIKQIELIKQGIDEVNESKNKEKSFINCPSINKQSTPLSSQGEFSKTTCDIESNETANETLSKKREQKLSHVKRKLSFESNYKTETERLETFQPSYKDTNSKIKTGFQTATSIVLFSQVKNSEEKIVSKPKVTKRIRKAKLHTKVEAAQEQEVNVNTIKTKIVKRIRKIIKVKKSNEPKIYSSIESLKETINFVARGGIFREGRFETESGNAMTVETDTTGVNSRKRNKRVINKEIINFNKANGINSDTKLNKKTPTGRPQLVASSQFQVNSLPSALNTPSFKTNLTYQIFDNLSPSKKQNVYKERNSRITKTLHSKKRVNIIPKENCDDEEKTTMSNESINLIASQVTDQVRNRRVSIQNTKK